MKKYIDAEWLEDNAKEYSLGYYEEDEWATPLSILDSAPSIDIVRCRECIHYGRDSERNTYGCNLHSIGMTPSDFCSYGSRSEKPNKSKEGASR